jgi:iron complex transport system permease protein
MFTLCALLLPWIGPYPIDLRQVFQRSGPDYAILIELRVPRTLLALFAGGALSLAGTLFQAMLRDALAEPYTLGISAGSSLGAVVVLTLGLNTLWGFPATWVGALAGAFGALALVMSGSMRNRQLSSFALLLSGMAMNGVCSAFIVVLHGLSSMSRSFSISRWLIGSVDAISYRSLLVLCLFVIACAVLVIYQAKSWNLLAVGEQWASARGIRVQRLLRHGYLFGSVLVAGAIALTGPIGFVGLIVPHAIRSRISPDHRILMPCAFLLGGSLLATCDTLGRMIHPPDEIPAGAVLALLGGPYLVWLIRRRLQA